MRCCLAEAALRARGPPESARARGAAGLRWDRSWLAGRRCETQFHPKKDPMTGGMPPQRLSATLKSDGGDFTACPCRGEVQPPDGCRGRMRRRGGLHERPVDRTTCRNCFLDRAPGTRVCPGEGPSHSETQVVKSRRCWSASRGCRRRASLPDPGATHQGSCMRVSSPSSSARRSWYRRCRPPTR